MDEVALRRPRRVSIAVVLAVPCAFCVGIVVVWGWLFRSSWVTAFSAATLGLVHPTLISAVLLAAPVSAVALLTGLTLRDFDLHFSDLRAGTRLWLAAYCGLQFLLLSAALLGGAGVHQGAFFALSTPLGLGTVIAQVFGTAVVEEAVFRGFVFRQVLVRVRASSAAKSCALAAAMAAVPFALAHIPQRLSTGTVGGDLAADLVELWIMGMVASYLYVRSRNLMVVMALHGLFNAPASLFASPLSARWAYAVVLVVVIAAFDVRGRRTLRTGLG